MRLVFCLKISNIVSVTGIHAFLAPDFAAGDQRGPCPGLNALANHGYIPHNGIVSVSIETLCSNDIPL